MTTEEYDKLIDKIRAARVYVSASMEQLRIDQEYLENLLAIQDAEEHRLAQQALAHMPIASRKLVVSE